MVNVGTAESGPVEQQRGDDLVAIFVLVLVVVNLVARDDFELLLGADGEGFAIGSDFFVARANLAQFEFGDLFENDADGIGLFRGHCGNLNEDGIFTLGGDHGFLAAEVVEAFLDDLFRHLGLLGGHRLEFAVIGLFGLDFERERRATADVDAAFETLLGWHDREQAQPANTAQQDGADVALVFLNFSGEVPEKQDQQGHPDPE